MMIAIIVIGPPPLLRPVCHHHHCHHHHPIITVTITVTITTIGCRRGAAPPAQRRRSPRLVANVLKPEPGADEETPLLELKDQVAGNATSIARLEAEAAEMRLRAELLDRAVGVPAPDASAGQKARLFVTNQVNSKLARFGPTRGATIAVSVLEVCGDGVPAVVK